MDPKEQRSRAQVDGIVKEITEAEQKKLPAPDAVQRAIAKAQAISRELVENYGRSLHLRPTRPSKAQAVDVLYEQFRQKFEKMDKDDALTVLSWLHACMSAESLRDHLV